MSVDTALPSQASDEDYLLNECGARLKTKKKKNNKSSELQPKAVPKNDDADAAAAALRSSPSPPPPSPPPPPPPPPADNELRSEAGTAPTRNDADDDDDDGFSSVVVGCSERVQPRSRPKRRWALRVVLMLMLMVVAVVAVAVLFGCGGGCCCAFLTRLEGKVDEAELRQENGLEERLARQYRRSGKAPSDSAGAGGLLMRRRGDRDRDDGAPSSLQGEPEEFQTAAGVRGQDQSGGNEVDNGGKESTAEDGFLHRIRRAARKRPKKWKGKRARNGEGTWARGAELGTRNPESERIRGRAEGMGSKTDQSNSEVSRLRLEYSAIRKMVVGLKNDMNELRLKNDSLEQGNKTSSDLMPAEVVRITLPPSRAFVPRSVHFSSNISNGRRQQFGKDTLPKFMEAADWMKKMYKDQSEWPIQKGHGGTFIVKDSGVYLVYSSVQVLYPDQNPRQSHGLAVNGQELFKCMDHVDFQDFPLGANQAKVKTCTLTGVTRLRGADRLEVQNLHARTEMDLSTDAMYFGAVLLSPLEARSHLF